MLSRLLALLCALHLALAPMAASAAQGLDPVPVTSALLADVQTLIGDQGIAEGSAGHMLLHGLAGCAFNEASGADCVAGFAAGVVGSLYAGYLHQNGIGADDPAIGEHLNTAELLGAFAGFVFSSGQGENVSLGGQVSQSGVENNYLTHAQWDAYLTALERCANDDACIARVSQQYFDLSAANTAAMLACGNDLACLAPHIAAMLEAQSDPALTERLIGLIDVIAPGIISIERRDRDYLAGSPDGWGAGFGEYSANNCATLDATACLGAWYEEKKVKWLLGGAADAATGMLLSLGIAVTPAAAAWLRTCAANLVCLNELAIAAGEAAAGNALGGATLSFSAAVGGKLVLQHGGDIIAVLDDAGRLFTPLSQEVDDAGRFLVQAADGTVGYLDEAGRFVANRTLPSYSTSQLQHEFTHAGDFGVTGNWNKANGEAFQAAIDAHISDPATQVIQGSYRNQPATLYYNANSGNVVFTKPDGSFWGGWKLSPAQVQNVTTHGNLQ